jgi:selenocysteine lyase/cysteine desulfurase
MRAALDYVHRIGVANIEAHTLPLARALNMGLRDLGFDVVTPEGNLSPIVAFRHGVDPARASEIFNKAMVKVSLREGGTQVRAGVALFNNQGDIDRLLEVAESLRS